jgi:hypothetical protein
MSTKSRALKGYKGRDSGTHRTYDFAASIKRFKKTGQFVYRGKGTQKGSGHIAGERWADAKEIDPESTNTKYSKNSPSFDEGVFKYKQSAKGKALDKSK